MKYIGQKVTIENKDSSADQGRIVLSQDSDRIVIRRDHKLQIGKNIHEYIRSRSSEEEIFYHEDDGWWNADRTSQITSL